jgi:diguanylate cyclase (GGDEF)-like protein/PAS domain S-box-containing protein
MAALAVLMAATAAVMAGLAAAGWRRRDTAAMPHLVVGMLCTAEWALAYALELTAPISQVQLWGTLKYVGIVALPPVWVMFVTAFTRRRLLSRKALALLAIEPLAVLALLSDTRTDQLVRFYADPSIDRVAASGPLFWVHLAYTGLVMWTATGFLVAALWRQPHVHRRRARLLVATSLLPWLLNLLYNFAVPPFAAVDLTPFAFLASEAVLLWGIAGLSTPDLRRVRRADIFEAVSEPVLVLDGAGRVVDANPAAERALGVRLPELVGDHVRDVVPSVADVLATVDAGHDPHLEASLGGRIYDLRVSQRTDRHGHVTSSLLTAHDVTERKATEREFERRSQHDSLTGLPNRDLFLRRLTATAASPGNVGLLYVDVDDFKTINDTRGHRIGDLVLIEVAARLRHSVRDEDLVARLAGDEFAVLLGDPPDRARLPLVAAHVVEAFRTPLSVGGGTVDVHVSVGAALAPGGPATPKAAEDLLACADAAMYAAKRAGRDRFELWRPPVPTQSVRRSPRGRRHQLGPSPGSSW